MSLDKRTVQIRQLIAHTLFQIFSDYPQYSITKHLYHILRKKGDEQQVYDWTEDKLLKKVEAYKDELTTELASIVKEEE